MRTRRDGGTDGLTIDTVRAAISTIPCQNVTMAMLGLGPNMPMAAFPAAPATASVISALLSPKHVHAHESEGVNYACATRDLSFTIILVFVAINLLVCRVA